MHSRYLLEQMEEHSTFSYDPQELDAYVQKNMDQYLQEMQEMGMEESPEEIKESILAQEKQNWMAEEFCKSRGIEVNLEDAETQADQMLEMMQLTGDELTNTVNAYIGYNVLKDNSVDEDVRMIEEAYYSEIFES